MGFTGAYIIFPYFFHLKHGLWVEMTSLAEAVLTSTHNLCFEQKYEKYQSLLSDHFQLLEMKCSIYLNRRVFVMEVRLLIVFVLLRVLKTDGSKVIQHK